MVGFAGVLAVLVVWYFKNNSVAVLTPQGPIGQKERNLILLAVGLSLIVVIPVYVMLVSFAWKYRASNKNARYDPKFDHSRLVESIWWGVPLIIISILAVATWKSSNELDPFKPLASNVKPMTVQVVALQWKWLFIYPQQNFASVNLAEFPVNVPIDFEITADAPMNSFWIPKLGGQIYAMSGMSTHLHLMANRAGDYRGSSANISGEGFASMKFIARASSSGDFDNWVRQAQQSNSTLSLRSYTELAKPSKNGAVVYYSSVQNGLYNSIVTKFFDPTRKPSGEGAT